MNCLICGEPLTEVDTTADRTHAPWLCETDRRGWFDSELTNLAVSKWRPQFEDFGMDGVIAAQVANEIATLVAADAAIAAMDGGM